MQPLRKKRAFSASSTSGPALQELSQKSSRASIRQRRERRSSLRGKEKKRKHDHSQPFWPKGGELFFFIDSHKGGGIRICGGKEKLSRKKEGSSELEKTRKDKNFYAWRWGAVRGGKPPPGLRRKKKGALRFLRLRGEIMRDLIRRLLQYRLLKWPRRGRRLLLHLTLSARSSTSPENKRRDSAL